MTYEEQEIWDFLHSKMRDEGFHYCFDGYSDWDEIKDEEFHKLRIKYLEIAKSLKDYADKKYEESQEIE